MVHSAAVARLLNRLQNKQYGDCRYNPRPSREFFSHWFSLFRQDVRHLFWKQVILVLNALCQEWPICKTMVDFLLFPTFY
jgi:hypothetical protein